MKRRIYSLLVAGGLMVAAPIAAIATPQKIADYGALHTISARINKKIKAISAHLKRQSGRHGLPGGVALRADHALTRGIIADIEKANSLLSKYTGGKPIKITGKNDAEKLRSLVNGNAITKKNLARLRAHSASVTAYLGTAELNAKLDKEAPKPVKLKPTPLPPLLAQAPSGPAISADALRGKKARPAPKPVVKPTPTRKATPKPTVKAAAPVKFQVLTPIDAMIAMGAIGKGDGGSLATAQAILKRLQAEFSKARPDAKLLAKHTADAKLLHNVVLANRRRAGVAALGQVLTDAVERRKYVSPKKRNAYFKHVKAAKAAFKRKDTRAVNVNLAKANDILMADQRVLRTRLNMVYAYALETAKLISSSFNKFTAKEMSATIKDHSGNKIKLSVPGLLKATKQKLEKRRAETLIAWDGFRDAYNDALQQYSTLHLMVAMRHAVHMLENPTKYKDLRKKVPLSDQDYKDTLNTVVHHNIRTTMKYFLQSEYKAAQASILDAVQKFAPKTKLGVSNTRAARADIWEEYAAVRLQNDFTLFNRNVNVAAERRKPNGDMAVNMKLVQHSLKRLKAVIRLSGKAKHALSADGVKVNPVYLTPYDALINRAKQLAANVPKMLTKKDNTAVEKYAREAALLDHKIYSVTMGLLSLYEANNWIRWTVKNKPAWVSAGELKSAKQAFSNAQLMLRTSLMVSDPLTNKVSHPIHDYELENDLAWESIRLVAHPLLVATEQESFRSKNQRFKDYLSGLAGASGKEKQEALAALKASVTYGPNWEPKFIGLTMLMKDMKMDGKHLGAWLEMTLAARAGLKSAADMVDPFYSRAATGRVFTLARGDTVPKLPQSYLTMAITRKKENNEKYGAATSRYLRELGQNYLTYPMQQRANSAARWSAVPALDLATATASQLSSTRSVLGKVRAMAQRGEANFLNDDIRRLRALVEKARKIRYKSKPQQAALKAAELVLGRVGGARDIFYRNFSRDLNSGLVYGTKVSSVTRMAERGIYYAELALIGQKKFEPVFLASLGRVNENFRTNVFTANASVTVQLGPEKLSLQEYKKRTGKSPVLDYRWMIFQKIGDTVYLMNPAYRFINGRSNGQAAFIGIVGEQNGKPVVFKMRGTFEVEGGGRDISRKTWGAVVTKGMKTKEVLFGLERSAYGTDPRGREYVPDVKDKKYQALMQSLATEPYYLTRKPVLRNAALHVSHGDRAHIVLYVQEHKLRK